MKKHVSTISDFPNSPHWAIIRFESIHIPGDERSRTHPGHGYPASTENVVKYTSFMNEDEWKTEVIRLTNNGTTFKAITAIPAVISTTVNVK